MRAIPSAENFIQWASNNGYTVSLRSKRGQEVPINSIYQITDVPGVLDTSTYFKITTQAGQDKTTGQAKQMYMGQGAAPGTTGVNISFAGPGTPTSAYYSTSLPSSAGTLIKRNIGLNTYNKKLAEIKNAQLKATMSALQSDIGVPQGQTQQPASNAPVSFQTGE